VTSLNPNLNIDTFTAIGFPSLPDFGYEMQNWNELNGMDFEDLVNKVGTGDFCLPYAVENELD